MWANTNNVQVASPAPTAPASTVIDLSQEPESLDVTDTHRAIIPAEYELTAALRAKHELEEKLARMENEVNSLDPPDTWQNPTSIQTKIYEVLEGDEKQMVVAHSWIL